MVLRRQRELTGLKGKHVFTREDGTALHDLQVPWKRWRYARKRLGMRYREPYQMRHTSVTWNLMIGKNLLWVAEQHGHSPAVMFKAYAKWLEGASKKDIEAMRAAMGLVTNLALADRAKEAISLTVVGKVLAEREGFEPSKIDAIRVVTAPQAWDGVFAAMQERHRAVQRQARAFHGPPALRQHRRSHSR